MKEISADIDPTLVPRDEVRAAAGAFRASHPYGDLAVIFGQSITTELLQTGLVQRHAYVPESGITYRIRGKEHVLFALALLGFSYRLTFIKVAGLRLDLPSLVTVERATRQPVYHA